MKLFVATFSVLLAAVSAAPSNYGTLAGAPHVAAAGYAHQGFGGYAHPGFGGYAHAAAPAPLATVVAPGFTTVHEDFHAGPPVHTTHVEHGVVGSRTIQVGTQQVQVGHEFYVAGQDVNQRPAYTYVAGPPLNSESTVPIAPPALAHAVYAGAAIPPAPRNLGPIPADVITQEVIRAPVRTHTRITPQVTRIEPELQVNRYAVDVPVHVPVPVEREFIVTKHVPAPYNVDVPVPHHVPAPYKVHPVHEIVSTPVIHQHTQTVHQPVHHAVAHTGYAHAGYAAAGYAHAAAPVYHAAAAAPVAVAAAAPAHAY